MWKDRVILERSGRYRINLECTKVWRRSRIKGLETQIQVSNDGVFATTGAGEKMDQFPCHVHRKARWWERIDENKKMTRESRVKRTSYDGGSITIYIGDAEISLE